MRVTDHNSLPNCLICLGGEDTDNILSVAKSQPYALECNVDYFSEMMLRLECELPHFHEYTFVFTRSVNELPEKILRRPNVVVFVMGDEWARVPSYSEQVCAVFKAPGQHMKLAFHKHWLRFNVMALLQHLRLYAKRFPKHHKDLQNNIFAIPYGYYRLPRRDHIRPINERTIDVSFTGSIDHKRNLGGLVKSCKVLSRERLVATIDRWKKGKRYEVDVKLSSYFPKAQDKPEHTTYPEILMNSKICLAPRGTHLETYRVCEAMYYGCALIAEAQPDHWFADNSPALLVDDWSELPALLDHLLENPAELQELQKNALDYWENSLSATAVARYIASCLQELPASIASNDASIEAPLSEAS